MNNDASNMLPILAGAVLALLVLFVMVLPAIIAFRRKHAYKWIILALSVFAWTGIVWLLALVWALWPQDKSAVDPILGNVTGLGRRNAGDTLGSVAYGQQRGYRAERAEDEASVMQRRN